MNRSDGNDAEVAEEVVDIGERRGQVVAGGAVGGREPFAGVGMKERERAVRGEPRSRGCRGRKGLDRHECRCGRGSAQAQTVSSTQLLQKKTTPRPGCDQGSNRFRPEWCNPIKALVIPPDQAEA